jgi:hypothetical protein
MGLVAQNPAVRMTTLDSFLAERIGQKMEESD